MVEIIYNVFGCNKEFSIIEKKNSNENIVIFQNFFFRYIVIHL